MKKVSFIIAVLVFLIVSTLAFCKKNERRGFIIGGGLGASYLLAHQTIDDGDKEIKSDTEDRVSVNTDIRIGLGFKGNKLLLYYWNKVNWFLWKSDSGREFLFLTNEGLALNGIHGIGATRYFKPSAPALYLNGGIGAATWRIRPLNILASESQVGIGVVGGVGYEFEPHWSVEGTFMWSRPHVTEQGVTTTTNSFVITLCLVALSY
jgi:hypothetical protein